MIGIIEQNKLIAKDIYMGVLQLSDKPNCAVLPGQFAHIKVPSAPHLLLRRPISINDYDERENTLQIVYQVKGEGTLRLSQVMKGTAIDLLFPLGNGFALPEKPSSVFVVGGGIGIAPLLYAIKSAPQHQYHAFLGFKSLEYAYQIETFKQYTQNRTSIASDDDSVGEKGFVSDLILGALQNQKPDLILACGPTPMLKALQKIIMATIPTQASLEERMGCGVGACLVCNCKIKIGDNSSYQRVCVDGPIFNLQEVDFT